MSANPNPSSTPEAENTVGILSDLRASGDPAPEAPELSNLSAAPKRRLSPQTLITGGVVLCSVGALFLMRSLSRDVGIDLDRVTISDKGIKDVVKPIRDPRAEERLWKELELSAQYTGSETEKIDKNPFLLDATPPAAAVGLPPPPSDNTPAILSALAGLQLNSVIQGPKPAANINGRIVQVGTIIDEWFVVAQIHDRSVDVIAENKTYTISMGEGKASSGNRAPRPPAAPRR